VYSRIISSVVKSLMNRNTSQDEYRYNKKTDLARSIQIDRPLNAGTSRLSVVSLR
jgi:hypothetical protein